MRKVERFVRKRLKEGYAPERIRKEILEGCLTKRWGDNHRVSHWATDIPYSWCGCKETFYCNTKKIHFTEVECKRARVCLCVDNETGEIEKHPVLQCPHAVYMDREEGIKLRNKLHLERGYLNVLWNKSSRDSGES